MNENELRETMALLDAAGVNAELCDTPVRLSSVAAHCGLPTEIGDDDLSDWVLLPKSLVGMYPEMFIPVDGDSMIDAGYEPGDRLRAQFGVAAHDGDNVLAWLDGRCTVKTLFTDEEDEKWLVPRNDEYDAIPLTEDMDVRILAVVVGVEKASARTGSRPLIQSVRRTKNKLRAAKRLSDEDVDELIVRIGSEVAHARQWFAVYKAMEQYEVQPSGDYQGFCARVRRLLPTHGHLPDAKEVARMEVMSFSKPIAMWTESNASVIGSRFRDYRRIALTMVSYLSEKR